jgi:hypothetical protein
MDWLVYGGSKELYDVLNSIALIFGNSSMTTLLNLLMLFSLFFAFIQGGWSGKFFSIPVRTFVIILVIFYGFLYPKATVRITDLRTGQIYTVNNVPFGIGLLAMFQTQLSKGITAMLDDSLNTGYNKYTQTGFGFGPFSSIALDSFFNKNGLDSRITGNLMRFGVDCFVPSLGANNSNAYSFMNTFRTSKDGWKEILQGAYLNGGLTTNYVDSSGVNISDNCKNIGVRIYNDIVNYVNNSVTVNSFYNFFASQLNISTSVVSGNLPQALVDYYNDSAANYEAVSKQSLLRAIFTDFYTNSISGSSLGNATNTAILTGLGAIYESSLKQSVQNITQGAFAYTVLPTYLSFIRIVIYFFSIFFIVLALTPLARSVGKVLLVGFVYLTLLEPMYVITNYLVNTVALSKIQGAANSLGGGSCLTLSALPSCFDANLYIYSSLLNWSVTGITGLAYLLAIAIVSGSGAALAKLSDSLGSTTRSLEGARTSRATAEETASLSNSNFGSSIFDKAMMASAGPSLIGNYQSTVKSIFDSMSHMQGTDLKSKMMSFQNAGQTSIYEGYDPSGNVLFKAHTDSSGNVVLRMGDSANVVKLSQGSFESLKRAVGNDKDFTTILSALYNSSVGSNSQITNLDITKGTNGYIVKSEMFANGQKFSLDGLVENNGKTSFMLRDNANNVALKISGNARDPNSFRIDTTAFAVYQAGEGTSYNKGVSKSKTAISENTLSRIFDFLYQEAQKKGISVMDYVNSAEAVKGIWKRIFASGDSKDVTKSTASERGGGTTKQNYSDESAGVKVEAGVGVQGIKAGASVELQAKAGEKLTTEEFNKYVNAIKSALSSYSKEGKEVSGSNEGSYEEGHRTSHNYEKLKNFVMSYVKNQIHSDKLSENYQQQEGAGNTIESKENYISRSPLSKEDIERINKIAQEQGAEAFLTELFKSLGNTSNKRLNEAQNEAKEKESELTSNVKEVVNNKEKELKPVEKVPNKVDNKLNQAQKEFSRNKNKGKKPTVKDPAANPTPKPPTKQQKLDNSKSQGSGSFGKEGEKGPMPSDNRGKAFRDINK